jgi:thiamine biosynthesis lipoprotein
MGCEIVVAGASRGAFAAIVALFEQRDRSFSRFRVDSELACVNAAPGSVVPISPQFARAAHRALAAARATGGLVVPAVGGYDGLAVGDRILRRPPGTRLDLDGVVKGMTVDDAASLLDGPGFVSAGGDIAARDTPVLVSFPDDAEVTLTAGGIATSGTVTRGRHLTDPATGAPSRSPWAYVTAVGRSCLAADVAAKAGFLAGDDGPDWLDRRGVAARFVSNDAVIIENGCWTRSL